MSEGPGSFSSQRSVQTLHPSDAVCLRSGRTWLWQMKVSLVHGAKTEVLESLC